MGYDNDRARFPCRGGCRETLPLPVLPRPRCGYAGKDHHDEHMLAVPFMREDMDDRQSQAPAAQRENFMTRSRLILVAGVAWTLTAVVLFLAVGTMSFLGLASLAVGGFLPPLVYAALSGGPTATIAEVLYDTEQGRSDR
jgi:hypothetical protein